MATTEAGSGENPDVEQLRAERDQLQAQVEDLQGRPPKRRRLRRLGAALLVFLACLTFFAAVPGVWARRNFLDTDRFVDRVGPLAEDEAVQDALTFRLTEQISALIDARHLLQEVLPERGELLAVPLASAFDDFVQDRVSTFVASDRFARLWESAARLAHETAVRVLKGDTELVDSSGGQITLNLIPVVDAVLKEITAASPEILGREVDIPDVTVEDIPATAITRLEDALGVDLNDNFGQFTVYDDGKLEAAQDAVDWLDTLAPALVIASVVFAGLALWVSPRRRRTLLQLAFGVTLAMVLLRRVAFKLEDEVAKLPPTEQGKRAAAVTMNSFIDPLTTFAAWALVVALIVAAVALVTGNYPWAVSLRRRTSELWSRVVTGAGDRARDETTVAWVTDHRDALLAGGAIVGFALLWAADLSWLGLLLVLAVVGVFELAVYRVGAPRPS